METFLEIQNSKLLVNNNLSDFTNHVFLLSKEDMTIYLDSEKNIKFGYFDRLLVDNFFSFNDLHLLQDLVAFSCWSYSADLLDVSDLFKSKKLNIVTSKYNKNILKIFPNIEVNIVLNEKVDCNYFYLMPSANYFGSFLINEPAREWFAFLSISKNEKIVRVPTRILV